MFDWLSDVLVIERIYWYLAVPFTILLLIQLVATFVGIGDGEDFDGGDGDVDLDDGDFEPGFRVFTVRNFITFFAIFGWSGITFSNTELGQPLVVLFSTVIAIIVLLIVSALFFFITKLASSGTMNIQRAIGATGEVYLPIPGNRKGMGKINVTVQGSFREMDAVTDEDKKLPRGAIIIVKDVLSNNILLVERLKKEEDV